MQTTAYGAVRATERQRASQELTTELTEPAEKEVLSPSARGGLRMIKLIIFMGMWACFFLLLTSPQISLTKKCTPLETKN